MIPATSSVGADSAPKVGYLLHGVMGAGHNLKSLAKSLCQVREDYRFLLIDLRYHGKSLGAPPPHTLASCADDLIELSEHLGRSPEVIVGHSLGGKVALAYGQRHDEAESTARLPYDRSRLRQIWTLDSDPGVQAPGGHHQVHGVVQALVDHPGPFQSRDEAMGKLRGTGLSASLANWLGTALVRGAAGMTWRFEVDKIRTLLVDYFGLDLWPYLERVSQQGSALRYDLLVAEHSDRWSGTMLQRAQTLKQSERLRVHVLKDAGHWVHVDNPKGLVEILAQNLV